MSSAPPDSKWPRLLSLSIHEFRTPMTVVAGYIRMLLKDRAGALTDQQRKLLEEAEKSCARLAGILTEMSELANLEAGGLTLNTGAVDLRAILAETVANLPPMSDRDIGVDLKTGEGRATVRADTVRLKGALTSLLVALRREVVSTTTLVVHEWAGEYQGAAASWIAIGDQESAVGTDPAPETLAPFDEWRGGCGLSLPVARRVIDAHGGAVWSPQAGTKAAAVVVLPLGV